MKSNFAKNLRYLRNKSRLTVEELAEKSGVTSSAIRSYEEGRARPRIDKLPAICDALCYHDVIQMITADLRSSTPTTNTSSLLDAMRRIDGVIKGLREMVG